MKYNILEIPVEFLMFRCLPFKIIRLEVAENYGLKSDNRVIVHYADHCSLEAREYVSINGYYLNKHETNECDVIVDEPAYEIWKLLGRQ